MLKKTSDNFIIDQILLDYAVFFSFLDYGLGVHTVGIQLIYIRPDTKVIVTLSP